MKATKFPHVLQITAIDHSNVFDLPFEESIKILSEFEVPLKLEDEFGNTEKFFATKFNTLEEAKAFHTKLLDGEEEVSDAHESVVALLFDAPKE